MDQPVNKHLIQKYLIGECDAAELRIIDDFLKLDNSQQLINNVLAEEWDTFQERDISDEDISRWKNRFGEDHLPKPFTEIKKLPARNRFFSLPYAAVWSGLLICFVTWYGISKYTNREKQAPVIALLKSENPMGQRSKIVLPDNSTVYLGGGSKLIYPERFAASKREISLQGEAFFEITKNPKKPFIIHTGNVQTRVLGTSFRINAFNGQPMLVEVATGKVRVTQLLSQGAKSLAVLTPGQSLKWDNKNAVLGTVAVNDLEEWKNGRLVFNRSTMREIAAVLERWYNVKIIFADPEKAEQQVTITLTANVPVNQIMDVLAGTASFHYRIKGNRININ
ncbi:putative anti-sigma factor [Arcticibacter svalbardensis MN12-7]|uniref:Putative anti-sigma factor n=1 Tax=Arcticibacter svalbardensis MN12-7 TaxID=1150600 RepID=R9GVS2_9SPHI|nr:FecR domain-containing protein [Arcticibacter svalbardensis]EOR95758.1 putative anti-sigma factor [Arcticibacter svalbardensis MN12-7]